MEQAYFTTELLETRGSKVINNRIHLKLGGLRASHSRSFKTVKSIKIGFIRKVFGDFISSSFSFLMPCLTPHYRHR